MRDRETILLDTNLLINAIKCPVKYGHFFDMLIKNNSTFAITEVTKIEFYRGTRNKNEYISSKNLLNKLGAVIIPQKNTIHDTAIKLGRIYSFNGINQSQISIPDLYQAAYLIDYPKYLSLITTDLQDYPLLVFDCEKVYNLSVEGKLVIVARFKAEVEKFKQKLSVIH